MHPLLISLKKKKSHGYPSSFVVNNEIVKDSNVLSELFFKMFNDSFTSDNLNSSLSFNNSDTFKEFLLKLDDDFSSVPDGISFRFIENVWLYTL